MKMRSAGQQVIAVSILAAMAYWALYLFLSPRLPDQLVRHVGTEGIGYSPMWLVVLIIGAAAALSIAIGIITGSSSLSVVQDVQHGRRPAVYNNIRTR